MIEGVKRRQNIITTVGGLFTEIVACVGMIFANPALGLILRGESNECEKRNSVTSHRISAFGFPIFLAFLITCWMGLYNHVLKKRRDAELRRMKEESRQVLQVSYVLASAS